MFTQKGITMARHKDVRKEIGTVSYTLEGSALKNKKFNLTEYFQTRKGSKLIEKEPKQVTKQIKIDDSKLKDNEIMNLLAKPRKDKLKKEEKDEKEKKEEDKQEALENFVDVKKEIEKQKTEEEEEVELEQEKQRVKEKEGEGKEGEDGKMEPVIEEDVVADNTKKKIIVTTMDKDLGREMFQV
jgi:hypothetical protein